MRLRRALALAGAVSAAAFTACKEPPFFPRWDSDMYMPLSTQPIRVGSLLPTGIPIPPGFVAVSDSFVTTQDLNGVLKDVMKNLVTDPTRCTSTVNPTLSCDQLKMTLAKSLKIQVVDTLFVANSQAGLNAATPGTIVFPFSMAPADATKTDSISLTQQSVSMLQGAGASGTTLWIKLRGRISNPTDTVRVTSSDSIAVTTSVTVRVATVH